MKTYLERLKKEGAAFFQRQLKKGSLPMVKDRQVLFIYQDTENRIKEIRLVHHIASLDRAPKFERIGQDNLFALNVILPVGARMEYTFGITYKDGTTEIIIDPHNPDKAWCPYGPKSVAKTAQYIEPTWAAHRDDIAHGKHEWHHFRSRIMKDTRYFAIYEPPGMKNLKDLPVIVIHDGSDYINYAGIIDVFDNLIADEVISPFVAVLSDPVNRNVEYSCTPDHPKFVIKELLPWVRKRYPVSNLRSHTALMGASFGAVASVYASFLYANEVGKLFLQSGSFRFQDLVKSPPIYEVVDEFDRITMFLEKEFLPHGPSKKLSIYLSCGTFEQILKYNQNFAKVMKRLGHPLQFNESHDGHNWISWRDHFKDGLTYLYPAKKHAHITTRVPVA